jgi:DNA polymerase III gamma/tau subunit
VSPDVLLAIANAADGAMRDAEVMLTKLAMHASDGSAVDATMLGRLLGLVPHTAHAELAEFRTTNKPSRCPSHRRHTCSCAQRRSRRHDNRR